MKKVIFLGILLLNVCISRAQYLIQSPDSKVKVTLHSKMTKKKDSKFLVPEKMTMKVFNERQVLTDNEIGLTVKSNGKRTEFGKCHIAKSYRGLRQIDTQKEVHNLVGRYNSILLNTNEGISLEVRVYDNGVAYRFGVSGCEGDYKILDVCNVLPEEKAIAILGTFEGEYVMPWRVMEIEPESEMSVREAVDTKTMSEAVGRRTKVIPWRDALSSVSIGTAFSWYTGDDIWGGISQDHNIAVDFTYKHIYGGLSFTPCHEMQYIHWEEVQDAKYGTPFDRVIGSVHAWNLGVRAGYCLPVQNGFEVWNFIPYVAASVMHLNQHDERIITYKDVSPHNHYLVGPGVKVQCTLRGGISLGAAYEHQFFVADKAPAGMNSLTLSIGKTF
jgi:hypothetical protein